MGTPDFAVPSLVALTKYGLDIIEVITQPNRPVGRKHTLTPPPVKTAALAGGILVFQPEKARDLKTIEHIRALNPDLIIVAAYGQIIPKAILDIPRLGSLNVHASLLPKYRGASPIAAAIKNGETETGITVMQIDELLDHGPIISQSRVVIAPDETGDSLTKKLSTLGAELLATTLPDFIAGKMTPRAQNHADATSTKLLTREDGKINWHASAEEIERMVRAYDPWPGTWTELETKDLRFKIKVLQAHIVQLKSLNSHSVTQPGTIFQTPTGFAVHCGTGALEIVKVQPEGKRPMSATDFLHGYPNIIRLGTNSVPLLS